jgi:uncharacterized protein YcbX
VKEARVGRVSSLHRYPVKSMAGEDLPSAEVTPTGLLGDRAYALIDRETGRVVSAKRPRRWTGILDYRASFTEPPKVNRAVPVKHHDRADQRSGRVRGERLDRAHPQNRRSSVARGHAAVHSLRDVTLAQDDLPKDPRILKAAFQHNEGNLGVKAEVIHQGRVEMGDSVWVE